MSWSGGIILLNETYYSIPISIVFNPSY